MHIALFGIAGSGKSTLTQKLVSANLQYIGLSASTLLRQKSRPVEISEINKDTLSTNQKYLVTAYESLKNSNENTIVEFHAVIETNNTEFWVPIEILKRLQPDLIFFINANPNDVFCRRTKDKSKPRRIISETEISKLQSKALLHLLEAYGKDKIAIASDFDAFRIINEAINKVDHTKDTNCSA